MSVLMWLSKPNWVFFIRYSSSFRGRL